MGILESKELNKNDPRFDYDQTSPQNRNDNSQSHCEETKNGSIHQKKSFGNDDEEEDKYAQNTQSSISVDNDVVWSQRGSNMGTPYKDNVKRKQVFTAMTGRVLHNKEIKKGLMNGSSRYDDHTDK